MLRQGKDFANNIPEYAKRFKIVDTQEILRLHGNYFVPFLLPIGSIVVSIWRRESKEDYRIVVYYDDWEIKESKDIPQLPLSFYHYSLLNIDPKVRKVFETWTL